MEKKRRTVAGCGFLDKLKRALCFAPSSSDTGGGASKSSSNRVAHGFYLVEGQSGHDMEDYHVSEYKNIKGHVLGLFAIFDGHLGVHVPSYLKDNLFGTILEEVMNNQDAVDVVKSVKDSQAAAKRLTTEALARKSKDDISCIVIRFG